MPTTLPNRPRPIADTHNLKALLDFYVIIGLTVALLVVTEAKAGIFQGLTVAEAILQATATDLASGEIAIVWTRPLM